MIVSKREQLYLVLILLVSVGLRVAVAYHYGNWIPANQDDASYTALGERLAAGHGYSFERNWYPFTPADTPTAHWSFLYTAFVAGVYSVAGVYPVAVRLAGAVLGGLLMPWLVYRLAMRVGHLPRVPIVAAALAAGYGYFVLFAARPMTETFYICALLWALERAVALEQRLARGGAWTWRVPLAMGIAVGAAALLRQAILPWAALMFLYLVWVGWRSGRFSQGLAATVVSGVVMTSWTEVRGVNVRIC